jgi:hypothetical protein
MPGGDKTGPAGSGPKTGRGFGYCADNDQPGYTQGFGQGFRGGGRGRGFGRGHGRGWRNRANMTDDQEVRGLLQQILNKLDNLGS